MQIRITTEAQVALASMAQGGGAMWRKPLPGEGDVAIDIDPQVYERLSRIAAQHNETMSDAILRMASAYHEDDELVVWLKKN